MRACVCVCERVCVCVAGAWRWVHSQSITSLIKTKEKYRPESVSTRSHSVFGGTSEMSFSASRARVTSPNAQITSL